MRAPRRARPKSIDENPTRRPELLGLTTNQITWADWTFRFGFDIREGLTLHQISIDGPRRWCYRASVAEMVVPYADPAPVRFWQNYFDAGRVPARPATPTR